MTKARAAYIARNKSKMNAQSLAWYYDNKARADDVRLQRMYGVTRDAVTALVKDQGSCCAICRVTLVPGADTHVDHDHVTGAVRGVLCSYCNRGLGMFRDSVATLLAAVEYLGVAAKKKVA
jgi:hypothetical protein